MFDTIKIHPRLTVMPNGIRVLEDSIPWIRSVSIGIFMHTGASMETPSEWGLSHFMEHMAFKGTQSRTARQIAVETDAMGGHFNAFTSRDCTCFYGSVIDDDLEKAISILSDLVLHANLAQDDMDRERTVILDELAMEEDDPEGSVEEMVHQKMYGDQPCAHEILGRADQVAAYSAEDLRTFRDTHYAPSRCVISISGHYDENELHRLLDTYLLPWNTGLEDLHVPRMDPVCFEPVYCSREIEQMHLCLSYPALEYGHPDINALTLLSSILGGQSSSRLYLRIREELGLAYALYTYGYALESTGTFNVYAACSPQNIQKVYTEIRTELTQFLQGGISDRELSDAKKCLRISNLMSLEHSSSRMMSQGQTMVITGRQLDLEKSLARLAAITPEQLLGLAEKILSREPVIGLLGPDAENLGRRL